MNTVDSDNERIWVYFMSYKNPVKDKAVDN